MWTWRYDWLQRRFDPGLEIGGSGCWIDFTCRRGPTRQRKGQLCRSDVCQAKAPADCV